MDTYVVVCLDDDQNRGSGTILASRQIFLSRSVAESYARSINPSRMPMVVAGDWTDLRVRGE